MSLRPVVLLLGPTATGKTGLAVSLAQQLDGEVVSVDSAQVYQGMDLGTAKPTVEERKGIPHHLIDLLDPAQAYSAARFRDDALALISEIRARDKVPVLAGGTMLYFHTLINGLSTLPAADRLVRQRIHQLAEQKGWPHLHAQLAVKDPASAKRLHPNDSQRILRALEIVELTGLPVEKAQQQREKTSVPGPVVKLGLWIEQREVLHRRIGERFESMMAAGFLDEVTALHARGDLGPDLPSMRAVGYRQLWAHLDGAWDLETAVQRGTAATRRLAKRQCTWLRSMPEMALLDATGGDLEAAALSAISRQCSELDPEIALKGA